MMRKMRRGMEIDWSNWQPREWLERAEKLKLLWLHRRQYFGSPARRNLMGEETLEIDGEFTTLDNMKRDQPKKNANAETKSPKPADIPSISPQLSGWEVTETKNMLETA